MTFYARIAHAVTALLLLCATTMADVFAAGASRTGGVSTGLASTGLASNAAQIPVLWLSADSLLGEQGMNLTFHRPWLMSLRWGDSSYAALTHHDDHWFAQPKIYLPVEELGSYWRGYCWFRLHIRTDSTLRNKQVAMFFSQTGGAEVYLDGHKVHQFGIPSKTPEGEQTFFPQMNAVGLWFDDNADHVLAVRYSNHDALRLNAMYGWFSAFAGIGINLTHPNLAIARQKRQRNEWILQALVAGFLFALSLLHIFFYLTHRKERSHLYYSAFVAAFALSFCTTQLWGLYFTGNETNIWRLIVFGGILWDAGLVLLPAFLYSVFLQRFPRRMWLLIALGIVDAVGQLMFRDWFNGWYKAFATTVGVWSLFIVGRAMLQKERDAWVLALGVFGYASQAIVIGITGITSVFLNTAYPFLKTFAWLVAQHAAYLCIPISMSVYLARRSARTSEALEQKLEEVRTLSAKTVAQELERERLEMENARKTKELEEARLLQLSMLPSTLPNKPDWDIAVQMTTATEVGGDYYDFYCAQDGSMMIAVGDATGHGMKAGTMVTVAKSHFQTLAAQEWMECSPLAVLQQMTRSIKAMNLRALYMALVLVKCNGNQLTIASAGMPPVMVYRAATATVETLTIKSMPLGSFVNFPYTQHALTLHNGDVMLLMSDGLPELFNPHNELLGYEAVEQCLSSAAAAARSANEVIQALMRLAETWAQGRPQDDDMSFVVVKVHQSLNTTDFST
jgi:serine phosphatase RsbU (regulator of sigma subunit)